MSASPTSKATRNASPATHSRTPSQTVNPLLLPVGGPHAQNLQDPTRRPSIQFLAHSNAALPKGSPKGREKRRMSSPPPPPVFQPRVSFDTFDKPADFIEENSFTLVAKHKDYEYTKRSRTFLCGCDDNEYSEYALQWLIDELVDDGDEIVCLRVVEKDDSIAGDRSVEKGQYRAEAETLMRTIQARNHENKAINLILEFAVGKVNKVIDEMINLYEPAILVVGTKGRSLGGFQGLLPGSVSKYCLQHSPVPVIVVRPSSKRDKARNKRAMDPSRHAYKDLLEKSGNLLDAETPRHSVIATDDTQPSSEDEAPAAAGTMGFKPALEASPLSQVILAHDDLDDKATGTSTLVDDLRSPGIVMKSPELQNLESPEITDSSSSDDDDDDSGGVPTSSGLGDSDEALDGNVIQGNTASNIIPETASKKQEEECEGVGAAAIDSEKVEPESDKEEEKGLENMVGGIPETEAKKETESPGTQKTSETT